MHILADIDARYSSSLDSDETITRKSPAKRISPQSAARKLFLRTPVPSGSCNGAIVRLTYPMRLLEAHLAANGLPLHYANGFFMYPSWRQKKPNDCFKRWKSLHRQMNTGLRAISPNLRAEYEFDGDMETAKLISVNFPTDIDDAMDRLTKAQDEFRRSSFQRAEAILTEVVLNFPCLPEAVELLVQCWRQQQVSKNRPTKHVLRKTAKTLEMAVENHELGLEAIELLLEKPTPGCREVVRERTDAVMQLKSTLDLVEWWLDDDKEYLEGRKELKQIRDIFDELTSQELTPDKREQICRKLAATPFGKSVRNKIAKALNESKFSFEFVMSLIAPTVHMRTFPDVHSLEKYVVKTLRHRIDDFDRPFQDKLTPSERKEVNNLQFAEEALLQEFAGRQPTDEQVSARLNWTMERLQQVRRFENICSYEAYMSD